MSRAVSQGMRPLVVNAALVLGASCGHGDESVVDSAASGPGPGRSPATALRLELPDWGPWEPE